MPRINPRLDPHELADLMADPEHWDLLDQVPRHPAAWPDLAAWAELALSDPSAAGAPPEPPGETPRKRRLRVIQPILWDEEEPEAGESDKSGDSAISDPLAIMESEPSDQSEASSSVSNMSEAKEISTGDLTADEAEEPPIRVRRRVPWARILALTAVIILAGALASVTIIAGQRHAHAQALASCNQTIQQSNKLYDQWNAALDAAKPLLALGDTDVTDPEALVSLRKAVEHHPTNEIPHCTADLSTAHLEENARTADARNKQTKTVLDELSKATTAVEQSQQARRLTDAKTKLSDAIAQAEDLYQRTETNTDVNVNVGETRVSLGAQLDTARNTLHATTGIAALNKAAADLNARTQRLSDAIKQTEETPSAPAGTSESQPAPIQQQPSTNTTRPAPDTPVTPQPTPRPSPSAPSWDVPSTDSPSTFPDTL
ncbi:hypothetical protein [Bifidobacterium breve]|uniref:hypothetical protein n=1 Tax=Bifidobacterium breve TaxID=1685 RepID=UPI00024F3931|nr:hypothetical protein [Bifidobacterium breve]EHS85331.1 hypothetical protein CECT7263_35813 [Bifidobacterium breve CECT 7263]OPG85854.1 hypothetical protein B5D08_07730 [Bifidobacterium breve]